MKRLTLAALFSFVACLPTAVAKEAVTRVALVSAGGGETGKDLLLLAETRLSGKPAIALLDRQEISRVLQEQKLAISGLGGSEQAIAVGKLLRVEVFAVLEMMPGEKQPLGLVVFDADTGVRLHDATFPAHGAEQTAQAIADTIQSACAKRGRMADGLRTVALLSARNADLPRAMDARCQAVAAMLQRSLTRCDDFAVLERKRLEHVNKERTLPAGSPAGKLLASLLTIDLEIGRGTDGKGLRAVALVHDAAGKQLAEARAAAADEDIASLAAGLLKELCKSLRAVHAPAAGDPAAEARLFFHEAWLWQQYDEQLSGGAFFQQFDDLAGELAAAESAYALAPGNHLYEVALADAVVAYTRRALGCDRRGGPAAIEFLRGRKPGELRTAFELALRALDLRMEYARRHESRLAFDDGGWYSVDSGLRAICDASAKVLPHCPAEARPALLEFREKFHRYFMATCMKWADEALKDRSAIGRFLEWWFDFDRTFMCAAADSDQYTSDLCKVIGRWLESWRQCGNFSFAFNDQHMDLTPLCFFILHDDSPHYRIVPRDYARLRPLLESMRKHPVPLVQEYGIWGQMWVAQRCGGPCPSFEELKTLNRKHIQEPGASPADPMRGLYYAAMLSAIEHLNLDEEKRRRERIELLQFMLERNELANNFMEVFAAEPADRYEAGQDLKLIQRVETMLNGNVHALTSARKGPYLAELGQVMERRRQEIESAWADLARAASSVPWKQVRPLLRRDDHAGVAGFASMVLHEGQLLTVGVRGARQGTQFEAFCVPLHGGPARSLGTSPSKCSPDVWLYQYSNWRACAGGGYFFVSAPDGGIHAFPLEGGKPFYIDEAAGLPCNAVQAMAWFEGRLYAGLGDGGYFVRYDVRRRRCEILASGRTKNGQLPFNDASPFGISYLAGDPKRHRLLLGLGFAGHLGYDDRWRYDGLWQYEPTKGSFRQLLKVSPADGSSVDHDAILLYGDTWLLRVDLKTDNADVRLASPQNRIGPGLDPTTAPYRNPVWNMPPMAEVDGWLWTVRPTFFRRSKDSGKVEWLPWVDTGKSVASYEYLQAVGDGSELVVGNDSGFWLLTLQGKPGPAAGPALPATRKETAK